MGADVKSEFCVVDLNAAVQSANATFNQMPCLVASRGGRGGYCTINLDRVASVVELARLQGWKSVGVRQ
eukprot:4250784-Lingulodinium_polyedra.AAC.1